MDVYIKNLSNDYANIRFNMTTSGWSLLGGDANPYYSDGIFNFQIRDIGSAWTPNHDYKFEADQIVHLSFICWTDHYLACSDSWTITFYGYDNRA